MVLPRASDSSQTERFNERAMKRPICCQPPPSIQSIHANDLCMRMKPPPTLLTHNFRNFRIAFPHLAFISQPSCQCAIAHASFRSSMNARIRGIGSRGLPTPQDFQSVRLPDAPEPGGMCLALIGGCAVSFVDLPTRLFRLD